MIKVLQILDGKSFGGIAKLFLDISNNIDKNISFEFLTASNIYDKWNNLNINRSNLKNKLIYNYRLYKFLKRNKYDIIHINSGAFFFSFFVVLICRYLGLKNIITHSHSYPKISNKKRLLIKILNPMYNKLIDVELTCSKKAAFSLYNNIKDVKLIKNGVEINKFKFNNDIRKQYRKKLNIDNKIVYGHIGRFDIEKNHNFLIDVFYKLQKKQDCVLLLIGTGPLENKIKEKVRILNLENKVKFLGFRDDISNLLCCMDFFLFPSIYEGLGIVLIEAQTSGLPVFVYKDIPIEAKISNNYYVIDKFDDNLWVNKIINTKQTKRIKAYEYTVKSKYDIINTAKELEKIYKDLMK